MWKHFEKIDGSKKVKCKVCLKEYSFHGRTSNLREHLVAKHTLIYNPAGVSETHLTKQRSLHSYATPRVFSEARKKDITERIVDMITLDIQPVNLEEGVGFHNLL